MGVEFIQGIDKLPDTVKANLSEEAQYVYMNAYNNFITVYLEDIATEMAWNAVWQAGHAILNSASESVSVVKAKDEEQLVFGWANVSIQADGSIPFEWQDDVIHPDTLEKAAYNFVLKHRETGEMHIGEAKGNLVESVMFTKQKMEMMGIPEGTVPEGWWVGFYLPDKEVFAKVKDGTYKMFSIQGKARKIKI